MRFPSTLACLASFVLAACGADDGNEGSGNTSDAGGSGAGPLDTLSSPQANCDALDLAAAPAVPITNAQVTPHPQGGTLVAGIFELASVKLYAQGIPVTGTAQARVEIQPGSASSGAARVALALDGSALGQSITQDVTGAGLYTISGSAMTVAEGCGGSNPLPALTYTASGTSLTLWTEYMITDPVAITIPIELVLAAE